MRQLTSRGVKKWVITLFCCLTVVFIHSLQRESEVEPVEVNKSLANGLSSEGERVALNPKYLAKARSINVEPIRTNQQDVSRNTEAKSSDAAEPISNECECKDSKGQPYDLCYHLPANRTIKGKKFNCDFMKHIEDLGFLSTAGVLDLSKQEMPEPAFVTAYSMNHAHEGRKQIEAFRKYFPTQKLIVYDLGLSEANLQFLRSQQNLEIRKFAFEKYPQYFKTLQHYRWKPVIVAEALREFGAVFYMDSSIRFKKGDLNHVYDLVRCRKNATDENRPPLKTIKERDMRENISIHESGWDIKRWEENKKECRKAGYMMHGYTGHGILGATHSSMFTYFPTDMVEIKKQKAKMYEAGFIFAVRTVDTMKILKWYILCALEQFCMVPTGKVKTSCTWRNNDRFTQWGNCHRYDQSAVNLLLTNEFWYDRTYYASEIVDFFNIWRI